MAESFRVSTLLPAPPERVYQAWLTGREHAAFTGGAATASTRVGGAFTAWDGYIQGKTLEMDPHRRIVQSWRTSDFSPQDPDSRLEVHLEPHPNGTRLTLVHRNLPDGQGATYKQGWRDHYFAPMKRYFSTKPSRRPEKGAR